MEATQDAQADNNGVLWFFAGCLLGLIGVIIAAVVEPDATRGAHDGEVARIPRRLHDHLQIGRTLGPAALGAVGPRGSILIVYVVLIVIIVEQANAMSTSTIQYIMRP